MYNELTSIFNSDELNNQFVQLIKNQALVSYVSGSEVSMHESIKELLFNTETISTPAHLNAMRTSITRFFNIYNFIKTNMHNISSEYKYFTIRSVPINIVREYTTAMGILIQKYGNNITKNNIDSIDITSAVSASVEEAEFNSVYLMPKDFSDLTYDYICDIIPHMRCVSKYEKPYKADNTNTISPDSIKTYHMTKDAKNSYTKRIARDIHKFYMNRFNNNKQIHEYIDRQKRRLNYIKNVICTTKPAYDRYLRHLDAKKRISKMLNIISELQNEFNNGAINTEAAAAKIHQYENDVSKLRQLLIPEGRDLKYDEKNYRKYISYSNEWNKINNDLTTFIADHHIVDDTKYQLSFDKKDIRKKLKEIIGGGEETIIKDALMKLYSTRHFASDLVIYAYVATLMVSYNVFATVDIAYNKTKYFTQFLSMHAPMCIYKLVQVMYLLTIKSYPVKHYSFMIDDIKNKDPNSHLGNCYWHAIANSCLFHDINPECPFSFIFKSIRNLNKDNNIFVIKGDLFDSMQRYSFIGGLFTEVTYEFHNSFMSFYNNRYYKTNSLIKLPFFKNNRIIRCLNSIFNSHIISPALFMQYGNMCKILLSYTNPKILSVTIVYSEPEVSKLFDSDIVSSNDVNSSHAQCVISIDINEDLLWKDVQNNSFTYNSTFGKYRSSPDAYEIAKHQLLYSYQIIRSDIYRNYYDNAQQFLRYSAMKYIFGEIKKMRNDMFDNLSYRDETIRAIHKVNKNRKFYHDDDAIGDIYDKTMNAILDKFNNINAYEPIVEQHAADNRYNISVPAEYKVFYNALSPKYSMLKIVPTNMDKVTLLFDPNNDDNKLNLIETEVPCAPWYDVCKRYDIKSKFILPRYATWNMPATYIDLHDPFKRHDGKSYTILLFEDDGEILQYDSLYDIAINKIKNKIKQYADNPDVSLYYKAQYKILTDFEHEMDLLLSLDCKACTEEYKQLAELENEKLFGGDSVQSMFWSFILYLGIVIIVCILVILIVKHIHKKYISMTETIC